MSHAQSFKTRLATVEDAKTLVEIGAKTFRDTFSLYNTPENMNIYLEKTFALDQITSELNNPSITFLLAYEENVVVGYAKLKEGENPSELKTLKAIEIERIYSVQEYLGRQVGPVLMQACLDIGRKRGYEVVWLGVWEHNPRAVAFYEKYGFEPFGSHPFWLGKDLQNDLLMKKKL